MKSFELDVVVTRGTIIESRHRVHAAVVDGAGRMVASARDAGTITHSRSCAKPFQVMPFLESGGFDSVGWGDDELALACASHGGEPEHVALARAMLASIGLEEGDLVCGTHDPLSPRGAKLLRESGSHITRLHNNCSGKHAAMLARAHAAGWPKHGYHEHDHQVQRSILATLSRWSGLPANAIGRAVDGCGVAEFAMPLDNVARCYASLAAAVARGEEVPSRIVHALTTRPFLFGGTDRFDTVVIEASNGRILPKVGAEGIHAVAILDQGIGVAVKVEDGSQRAQYPALLRVLQLLDALPGELPPRLNDFFRRAVRSTRGEQVGEVRVARCGSAASR